MRQSGRKQRNDSYSCKFVGYHHWVLGPSRLNLLSNSSCFVWTLEVVGEDFSVNFLPFWRSLQFGWFTTSRPRLRWVRRNCGEGKGSVYMYGEQCQRISQKIQGTAAKIFWSKMSFTPSCGRCVWTNLRSFWRMRCFSQSSSCSINLLRENFHGNKFTKNNEIWRERKTPPFLAPSWGRF